MLDSQPNTRYVLVLYVGGTIGMRTTDQGLAPGDHFHVLLHHALALREPETSLPRFEVDAFGVPIDSAEATPADWSAIAAYLVERWSDFDGFVVLHGTDTLAYTASALSFMLRSPDKPVIVTGAQLPLDAPGSDALANVVAALHYASQPSLREICIAFGGLLLRGNRSTKVSTKHFAAFNSPNALPLSRELQEVHPSTSHISNLAQSPRFEVVRPKSGKVHAIWLTPGFAPEILQSLLMLRPQGILLVCYGAGTLPSLSGRTADFLALARQQGVVVVAVTQVPNGGLRLGTYAAGQSLLQFGVVDGRDLTFEAAYTKLHHLIGRGDDANSIRHAMATVMAGEMSEVNDSEVT